MFNCTKCGTEIDHPLKTWKIKQTPIALFECPSCKTKWRRKFIEAPTVTQIAPPRVQEPLINIQAQTLIGEQKSEPIPLDSMKTVAKNNVALSTKSTGIFSGIRLFFLGIFKGIKLFFLSIFS